MEKPEDYTSHIKDFLLSRISASIETIETRKSFVLVDSHLPQIWNELNINGSNKDFVDSLIDKAASKGMSPDGSHPLLSILNGVRNKVGKGSSRELSDLKVKVINNVKPLEQAYVGLIVDSDFVNYIPVPPEELRYHGLENEGGASLSFDSISDRINKLGSSKYKYRRQYPNFDIDPWIYYNCGDLAHWSNVIERFKEDRFLAILVDVGVFDSPCSSTVEEILNVAFSSNRVGMGCIMNHLIRSPKIPDLVIRNKYFHQYLRKIDEIADFLWDMYDSWKINREHGGSVIARTSG